MSSSINRCLMKILVVAAACAPASGLAQVSSTPVIAVTEIESAYSNFDTASIRSALETALSKTRKYKIMERARLSTLLEERGLSLAGVVDGNASLGGFSGVDYLITGRVSRATLTAQSVILMAQCEGEVALDIKTVDVHTGEIRFADIIMNSAVVNTTGTEQNPCYGISSASLQPLIVPAAEEVVEKLSMALFPIKVVRVAGGEVYLNYGEPVLLQGDYLEVVQLGEGFRDPDTGEILGADEENIGYLFIRDVRPKFSIASVAQQQRQISVGDIVHKLSDKETRAVRKMLSDIEKARRAKERSCNNARKKQQRNCRKNADSSRCRDAEASAERVCA